MRHDMESTQNSVPQIKNFYKDVIILIIIT